MAAERRITEIENAMAGANRQLDGFQGVVSGLQDNIKRSNDTLDNTVSRIEGIENALTDLATKLGTFDSGLATQKAQFANAIGEQISECKAALIQIVEGAKTEFMKVNNDVNALHNQTAEAFTKVEDVVKEIRELGPHHHEVAGTKGYKADSSKASHDAMDIGQLDEGNQYLAQCGGEDRYGEDGENGPLRRRPGHTVLPVPGVGPHSRPVRQPSRPERQGQGDAIPAHIRQGPGQRVPQGRQRGHG